MVLVVWSNIVAYFTHPNSKNCIYTHIQTPFSFCIVADSGYIDLLFSGCDILFVPWAFPWKSSCRNHSLLSVFLCGKWLNPSVFLTTFWIWSLNLPKCVCCLIQALSVMILFIRCTAINPTDKTSFNKKRKNKPKGITKLNYGYIFGQIIVRFFKRVERKILRSCIRRKYLDPLKTSAQMEPLLPFPLVIKDDAVSPHRSEDDISFCALCDFEVGYIQIIFLYCLQ